MDMLEKKRKKLLKSLCEYPYIISKKNKRPNSCVKLRTINGNFMATYKLGMNKSSLEFGAIKQRPSNSNQNHIVTGPVDNKSKRTKKKVLYRGKKVLGGVLYVVDLLSLKKYF